MAKKKQIVMVCDKCGEPMPIDLEKSNSNWTVYKQQCSCGGKGKIKF
jgi:hypothetical protein